MSRRLAAVHLPCFGLQAMLRRRSDLEGRPLALEGEGALRGRVAEASRHARAEGVEEGQTLAQARAACPDLVLLIPDAGMMAEARQAVAEALLRVSPRVEWSGGGSFCLEATGLARLHGSERALLARAAEALEDAGFVGRAACASTRLAAAVAARQRGGACIPDGEEAAFLAPLPLSVLPLGPETLRRLDLLGIRTLGAFAKLPPDGLADRFGREGARWQRLMRGEDPAPLLALAGSQRLSVRRELEAPVEGLEAVTFLLASCCEELADALAGKGMLAARLHLELILEETSWGARGGRIGDRREARTDIRVLEPARPLASSRALLSLLRLELDERRLAAPLLGLVLGVAEERPARGLSGELFGGSLEPEALAAALDRVRALVGRQDVVAPAPRDAHRREARVGWEPFRIDAALAPAGGPSGSASDAALMPAGQPSARPIRQDVHAGPDTHGAFGPCAASEEAPGQRILEHPLPVRVRLPSAERPGALEAEGSACGALGLPAHLEIAAARGPWRTCGEWWDGGADVDRDEWLLAGVGGGAYRVVRDRRTWQWSLLGMVD